MCNGSDTEHEMVDNPRRASLIEARSGLSGHFRTLRTVLDKAESAMEGGAWEGPPATTWSPELTGRVKKLETAATNAYDEFTDAIEKEPHQVRKCETTGMFSPYSTNPFSLPFPSNGTG